MMHMKDHLQRGKSCPGYAQHRSDVACADQDVAAHGRSLRCTIFGKQSLNATSQDLPRYRLTNNDDDLIHFLDEEGYQFDALKHQAPWKILVADDDVNVHDTTLLALNGVLIHGRPLEFLHAYSAAQAKQVLIENPDTSLVLLDVVMETIDAGLRLVEVIRNELGQHQLRIVLRTGQPGYAPEKRLNNDFAIDGYTTKSKLTRSMLISVLNDTLDSNNPPVN